MPYGDFRKLRRAHGEMADGIPVAPLGRVLAKISRGDLVYNTTEPKAAQIVDCETVATFNWLEERDAHIIVPGM